MQYVSLLSSANICTILVSWKGKQESIERKIKWNTSLPSSSKTYLKYEF